VTTLHRLRALAPPALGNQLSSSFWARLAKHYASPPRAYHNLRHVHAVAEWFAVWQGAWQRPCEVFAAVLFHDAIYDATAADNEARSAALAREALAHTDVDVSLVATLIHGTALSSVPPAREAGSDLALFVDCDRAVLGAAPADYARYARGIAEEYSRLPPADYRRGRRAFLRRAIAADVQFLTPGMQERLGSQARENLEWELSTLAD
jgi:predicted metal-dependent HD superfamily phosphohydrolase